MWWTGIVISLCFGHPNSFAAAVPAGSPIVDVQILGATHVPLESIRNEITLRKGENLLPEKAEINMRAIEALGYFQEVSVDY